MSCRILIVEDEAITAADLESTLMILGHNVVGVIDYGWGAIDLAKTLLPDIIFMDIKLKGDLDGIETARMIDGVLGKEIPFIFATANPAKETNLSGKQFWIQKPYAVREIVEAIRQIHESA